MEINIKKRTKYCTDLLFKKHWINTYNFIENNFLQKKLYSIFTNSNAIVLSEVYNPTCPLTSRPKVLTSFKAFNTVCSVFISRKVIEFLLLLSVSKRPAIQQPPAFPHICFDVILKSYERTFSYRIRHRFSINFLNIPFTLQIIQRYFITPPFKYN